MFTDLVEYGPGPVVVGITREADHVLPDIVTGVEVAKRPLRNLEHLPYLTAKK